jgi:hypothetical protein
MTAETNTPPVGEHAPEFRLRGTGEKNYDINDYKDYKHVVLYFYPKDDTPGCTAEACEFRDANDAIRERGAEVWGVSPQGSGSKAAFRAKFGLPFENTEEAQPAEADESAPRCVPTTSYARRGDVYTPLGTFLLLLGVTSRCDLQFVRVYQWAVTEALLVCAGSLVVCTNPRCVRRRARSYSTAATF